MSYSFINMNNLIKALSSNTQFHMILMNIMHSFVFVSQNNEFSITIDLMCLYIVHEINFELYENYYEIWKYQYYQTLNLNKIDIIIFMPFSGINSQKQLNIGYWYIDTNSHPINVESNKSTMCIDLYVFWNTWCLK